MKTKIKTIDMTPTWAQSLPTWKLVVETAFNQLASAGAGHVIPSNADPQGNLERFWAEMQRMAETADKWNEHVKNMPVDTAHEEGRDDAAS